MLVVWAFPLLVACSAGTEDKGPTVKLRDSGVGADGSMADGSPTDAARLDTGGGGALEVSIETGAFDAFIDPDAACASNTAEAVAVAQPVDIIFMVDNSSSMDVPIKQVNAGLNAFAASIAAKTLDYRVVMLSLRGKTPVGSLYPVCIPEPLAGDANCGNGPRFFQSSIDIRSTQPLEQFLGSMDQTIGYREGESRGGQPWKHFLRPNATKTIVIVTDHDSRLTATQFETFAGGKNPAPFAAADLVLPPGILHTSRMGLFAGYTFAGIYGWASETDSAAICKYSNGTSPPAAGQVYTNLVKKTGGPRAKICDGAAAWTPFFDAVATAVVKASKLACDLALPVPATGTLDASAVNVRISSNVIPKVANAAACGAEVAWYYDDDLNPTKVLLCPAACDAANASVGVDKPGKIDVLFGCKTIIK